MNRAKCQMSRVSISSNALALGFIVRVQWPHSRVKVFFYRSIVWVLITLWQWSILIRLMQQWNWLWRKWWWSFSRRNPPGMAQRCWRSKSLKLLTGRWTVFYGHHLIRKESNCSTGFIVRIFISECSQGEIFPRKGWWASVLTIEMLKSEGPASPSHR